MANDLLWGFSKGIKSIIIVINFYRPFVYFVQVLLIQRLPLIFFSFLRSIEFVSYYNYKNHDFVQFMTTYNFIFSKRGRPTELQKSANETFYASSQISPTIFLEAKCPISSTHSG